MHIQRKLAYIITFIKGDRFDNLQRANWFFFVYLNLILLLLEKVNQNKHQKEVYNN